MKSKMILIKYGIIGGLIVIGSFFLSTLWLKTESGEYNMDSGMIFGYVSMLIALSTVFLGVKAFRDKNRNGIISFKDAFLNGLIIVLVASLIYVIGWEIYFPNFMPDFADQYLASQKTAIANSGVSPKEVQTKISKLESMMENYENPLFRMPMTFLEIFPVGLVIALVSAFILKKKSVV